MYRCFGGAAAGVPVSFFFPSEGGVAVVGTLALTSVAFHIAAMRASCAARSARSRSSAVVVDFANSGSHGFV